MSPWHLGTLHPAEQVLTVVLAFGPFLLLGAVVVVQRRRDAREEQQGPSPHPGDQREDGL